MPQGVWIRAVRREDKLSEAIGVTYKHALDLCLRKSIGELMTDERKKTRIRTNQSHHIWPTGGCSKDIYLLPWALKGLLFLWFSNQHRDLGNNIFTGYYRCQKKKLRNRFKVGNFILCEKKRYFFYYHELGFNSQLRILKMIFLLDIY